MQKMKLVRKIAQAYCLMEDLVSYAVRILDITLRFIDQQMQRGMNAQALQLVEKTVDARMRKLGEVNPKTVATYHLLLVLLNKVKKHGEAVECCLKLQRREFYVFGKQSVEVVETKAELARALYWVGERAKSEK